MHFSLILLFTSSLFFVGCKSRESVALKPTSDEYRPETILGLWKSEDIAKVTIEFRSDGTAVSNYADGSTSASVWRKAPGRVYKLTIELNHFAGYRSFQQQPDPIGDDTWSIASNVVQYQLWKPGTLEAGPRTTITVIGDVMEVDLGDPSITYLRVRN